MLGTNQLEDGGPSEPGILRRWNDGRAYYKSRQVEIDPRDLADISYSVQECGQVTAVNRARIECRRGRGRGGGSFWTER